jgi:tRNA pseudouridine38-40 synthase
MKIALCLSYVGTHYHGFQYQSNVSSIQAEVEKALSIIACHPVSVYCAGRTDKGVHASHQIVHFETETSRDFKAWTFGMNHLLPKDINVNWAVEVPVDFHARFNALSRSYHYVIYNHPIRPTHFPQGVLWYPYLLNEKLMQAGADYLVGTHDFSAFRDKECQAKHPIRTIHRIDIQRYGHLIVLDIQANAFLHHMVRNIVGTLLPVGQAFKAPIWVDAVLSAQKRSEAGVTAPAQGLYLTAVNYPEAYVLPTKTLLPWFMDHLVTSYNHRSTHI